MGYSFEEKIISKIEKHEELTEKELKELVEEYGIYKEYGGTNRWDRDVFTVVDLNGRTFGIDWCQGLTENQDDSFLFQPYEVKKYTYEKTITVNEWVRVD